MATTQRIILLNRFSLATLYLYFGSLKLFSSESPVFRLVAEVMGVLGSSFSDSASIKLLALFEILIGIGFLIPKMTRFTFFVFLFHMACTFLPLFLFANETFLVPPIVPSLMGQYIIKNIALLSCGITLFVLYRHKPVS